ncbi:hypothetical protein KY343_05670 [Candidatus Woesearchaeota archaeon]|nr:hypothetical protein [Candidatus Woesearchaeota archaeon]
MPENNKPVKKFRAGAISAAVFKNETVRDGRVSVFYTIVIDRTYKDKNDQWQRTNSFRFMDLPNIRYVSDKAFEFLVEMRNESKGVDQQQPIKEEIVM